MKPIDVILIIILAAVLFFAVRRTLRTRKSGGCGCGCPGCDGSGCHLPQGDKSAGSGGERP